MLLKLVGILGAVLGNARIIFDFLTFIPAAKCVYKKHTAESCPQELNPLPLYVNTVGTLLEVCSSVSLILALFMWRRFHVKNYFRALWRVGHFWVWFTLCATYVATNLVVKMTATHNKNGSLTVLGVGLVLEMSSLTLLAAAINFVAPETYEHWVEQRICSTRWRKFFRFIYCLTLFAYLFRNLGMLLYDTALVSMSISPVKGTATEKAGEWDILLLVLAAAFRGSFVKFFFAKLFQGQVIPTVCENITDTMSPVPHPADTNQNQYRILDDATDLEQSNSSG